MPIAKEIWIETIRPKEGPSVVASFDLYEQGQGDPARTGQAFSMEMEGFGEVVFSFVCCLKGQAIYSASLANLATDLAQTPERAQLLCSELLRASP